MKHGDGTSLTLPGLDVLPGNPAASLIRALDALHDAVRFGVELPAGLLDCMKPVGEELGRFLWDSLPRELKRDPVAWQVKITRRGWHHHSLTEEQVMDLTPREWQIMEQDWEDEQRRLRGVAPTILKPAINVSERQRFVKGILDEKGWSIPRWAQESIRPGDSGSVDFKTAYNYLNGMKTNDANRRALAKGLGVSIKNLPT